MLIFRLFFFFIYNPIQYKMFKAIFPHYICVSCESLMCCIMCNISYFIVQLSWCKIMSVIFHLRRRLAMAQGVYIQSQIRSPGRVGRTSKRVGQQLNLNDGLETRKQKYYQIYSLLNMLITEIKRLQIHLISFQRN